METVKQPILIANSYLDSLSLLQISHLDLKNSLIWQAMINGAKLYQSALKVLKGVQIINHAKNKKTANQGYGILISAAANTLSSVAKIGTIYFIYQLSSLAELALIVASYLGSMLESTPDQQETITAMFDEP